MNKTKLMIYTITIFCCTFALSDNSYSKEKFLRYPVGCTVGGFKFDYYNVIFKPTALYHPQTIYFVHNLSSQTVHMLYTDAGNRPYTAPSINGSINPKLWSVLALDEKTKFICTNYDKSKGMHNVIDCSKVLEICEFQRTRFGPNTHGNYWVSQHNTIMGSVSAVRWHGILLTDPKKNADKEMNKDV